MYTANVDLLLCVRMQKLSTKGENSLCHWDCDWLLWNLSRAMLQSKLVDQTVGPQSFGVC